MMRNRGMFWDFKEKCIAFDLFRICYVCSGSQRGVPLIILLG